MLLPFCTVQRRFDKGEAMPINVHTDGLRHMAACCDNHASNVASSAARPPEIGATSVQASAAAVAAIHSLATATGSFLGVRLVATSVAAGLAADAYDATEESNVAGIENI
jgi:hypothetical protein